MSSIEDLTLPSAARIAGAVRAGELRAESVTAAYFERIRRLDGGIGAYLELLEDSAREAARGVDARRAAGKRLGRLAGVPVALKDLILARGSKTTCGSRMLEEYRSPYDATVVERLRAEDAVLLGKTNLDEFAMGSSTENSAFFPTRNPWDPARVPGGSSGGSAAAVAARMAALAFGSDTGGSIRQPASFCGVAGLKPGYGTVSRFGLAAFASSLDQIGPLARGCEDAALALSVIAGHDARDATSAPGGAKDYLSESGASAAGLRIGLPREYFASGIAPEVETSVRAAAEEFRRQGAELVELSLPHTRYALSVYYLLAPSEASANLARYDGIRYGARAAGAGELKTLYERSRGAGFGAEVKRRIMLGTYALSAGYYEAYYRKAQQVRSLIRGDFEAAFAKVDLLLAPTAPTTAFPLGAKSEPLDMYLADIFTLPCSLAGAAGLSIPCGRDAGGLPIGLQLMGRAGKEGLLLAAGRRFEEARPFPICPEPSVALGGAR